MEVRLKLKFAKRISSRGFACGLAAVFSLLVSSFSQAQSVDDATAEPLPTFAKYHSIPARDPLFQGDKTYEVTVEFLWREKNLAIISDGTETATLNFKGRGNIDGYQVGDRLRVTGFLRRKANNHLKFFCKNAVKIGLGN